jgi:hypothetical protein
MDIPCIKCGATDSVMVSIDTGEDFHCSGCDETYTLDDVKLLLGVWSKILPWLEDHPARKEKS